MVYMPNPSHARCILHIHDALSEYRTTVSSLSEQTAVFYLAGPQAAKALSLAGCDNTPARGHAMEWEFEDQKVGCNMYNIWDFGCIEVDDVTVTSQYKHPCVSFFTVDY